MDSKERTGRPLVGRISSKHQITIPVDLMRKVYLRAGDQVEFTLDAQGRIVMKPVRSVPDYGKFIGLWRDNSPYRSTEELIEDLRGPVLPEDPTDKGQE